MSCTAARGDKIKKNLRQKLVKFLPTLIPKGGNKEGMRGMFPAMSIRMFSSNVQNSIYTFFFL